MYAQRTPSAHEAFSIRTWLRWGTSVKITAIIVIVFSCMSAVSAVGQDARTQTFLTLLPDLPLMDGLYEIEEAGFAFDKPAGRIVESYAEGHVRAQQVLAFYNRTLPQLGWQITGQQSGQQLGQQSGQTLAAMWGGGRFVREGESLEIAVLSGQPETLIRFTLVPKPGLE